MSEELSDGRFELESSGAGGKVLGAYDAETDSWDFPQASDFWGAVSAAHARGERGAGRRIAIVDSACDLSIPKLARQTSGEATLKAPPGEPAVHGTAVALLVATAAPEAHLDIYEITRDGIPQPQLIAEALGRIGDTDTDVVCLSLGRPQIVDLTSTNEWIESQKRKGGARGLIKSVARGEGPPPPAIARCSVPICLCEAVDHLAEKGPTVVAAVGNAAGRAFCPARARGALAVGFRLDQREVVAKAWEAAWAIDPSYSQSAHVDLTIMQPPGVLGSSFAAPLIAGALSLGVDKDDLPRFVGCARAGAIADLVLAPWYSKGAPRGTSEEEFLRFIYMEALTANPIFPNLGIEPGVGASIFTASYVINAGLYFLLVGELDIAEALLRWCRKAVPINPHAAANLGKVLYLKAQSWTDTRKDNAVALAEMALKEYDAALRIRPGFGPYVSECESIAAFLDTVRPKP